MDRTCTEVSADALAASLVNLSGLLLPCLDAASARSVIEVGAFRGELTRELLGWASRTGARVRAIDPDPTRELQDLANGGVDLHLVTEPSLDALGRLPAADAVIIDGDHNYYTVLRELRLIRERGQPSSPPLIALHDVCWPHARRDAYYAPERIPDEHRQPLVRDALLAPGVRGTATAGIRFPWAAAAEGGPGNGVLTAVEDFLAESEGLRFALVPAFFGLGVIWPADAPWGSRLADFLEPWDRSPILERLEAIRVSYLVARFRLEHQEALLRSLLHSRAFALAERISGVRQRGAPAISRESVRRALGETVD